MGEEERDGENLSAGGEGLCLGKLRGRKGRRQGGARACVGDQSPSYQIRTRARHGLRFPAEHPPPEGLITVDLLAYARRSFWEAVQRCRDLRAIPVYHAYPAAERAERVLEGEGGNLTKIRSADHSLVRRLPLVHLTALQSTRRSLCMPKEYEHHLGVSTGQEPRTRPSGRKVLAAARLADQQSPSTEVSSHPTLN